MTQLSITIGADAPSRLDKALVAFAPEGSDLSRTRIAALIAEGQVTRAGVPVTSPKAPVLEGERYDLILPPPAPTDIIAQDIPLDILHEDEDLIVVNKPTGMVVHPAPGSPDGTLVNALLHHFGGTLSGVGGVERPGIVHRIDKETTGLLVVAKSDRAHHGLAAQFAAHSVDRLYRAVCLGAPDASDARLRGLKGLRVGPDGVITLTTQIGRHRTDRKRQAVLPSGGRHATTHLEVLERFGTPPAAALVECRLETGRTHQIRVHMAHMGHPLAGDPTYNRRRATAKALGAGAQALDDFPRQALHAATLGFTHPVSGTRLNFEAPLPADMVDLLTILRG